MRRQVIQLIGALFIDVLPKPKPNGVPPYVDEPSAPTPNPAAVVADTTVGDELPSLGEWLDGIRLSHALPNLKKFGFELLSDLQVCMNLCIDMCAGIDMCMNMCIDMCIDICI